MSKPRAAVLAAFSSVALVSLWLVALAASAQLPADGLPPRPETYDWMTAGLTPLLALLGLGILIAVIAALIAYVIGRMPDRRSRA